MQFRERLQRDLDCIILIMKGDGACLFRGIAHHVYKDQECHKQVRNEICDEMISNKEKYRDLIRKKNGIDLKEHVKAMRDSREYGGEVEIKVAMKLYGRIIKIFSQTSPTGYDCENNDIEAHTGPAVRYSHMERRIHD